MVPLEFWTDFLENKYINYFYLFLDIKLHRLFGQQINGQSLYCFGHYWEKAIN